ncbi:THBS1 [Mytilus edulis]|uniref:THBS1 n=1 Tax=Mytilus edulis TaxID=6550 RepID=A0A8S3S958_MYTED|nr:THBS1 [Mytilus edulis]
MIKSNTSSKTDSDGDGVGDVCDNCVIDANTDQTDRTGQNSVTCDSDPDGDGIASGSDNCPFVYNLDQANADGDLVGDVYDNCPYVTNSAQTDTNENGDFCDTDIDGDGVLNDEDNCVYISNPSQTDSDGNHRGDVCESDYDQDGTIDTLDNCPNNKFINESDFGTYTGLDLNPELTLQPAPSWMILHGGKEIRQISVTTKPVAYVGMSSN